MSEQTGLLVRSEQSFDDVERAAKAMVASGFFQDSKSISQAIVKILAGRELGFGPFASMTGVYIIQGRPSIGANLMASAVKGSGRYDYRVTENTDQACEITFFENGKEIGKSKFTHADAIKAGTKNLDKFPRNMLFARAMSNGVRWFTPDAFNGNAVYTPEELGADIDIEGNVIPGSFQEVENEEQPEIVPLDTIPAMSLDMAITEKNSKGVAYGELDDKTLSFMYGAIAKKERTEEHIRKMDAIKVILNSRN